MADIDSLEKPTLVYHRDYTPEYLSKSFDGEPFPSVYLPCSSGWSESHAAQWLGGGNNPKQKLIKNCQFFSFIPFSKAIVTRSISLLSQNLLKSTYNIQQLEIIIIFLRFRKKFRKFNTSYIDIIDTIFYIWYSFSHFEIFLRYQIIIS